MARFILVRHADSPWTPDEARPLSPTGRADALELARRLRHVDIGGIHTSPFTRAVQTVEPLAHERGLPIAFRDELRECLFGDFGALSFEDASVIAWRDLDRAWPGGESPRQGQQRILGFVRELAARQPERPQLLSTHGTLLTLLLNAFDPSIGYEFWRALRRPDVFEMEVGEDGRARWWGV